MVHFEVSNRLLPILNRAALRGVKVKMQDVLERFAFDNICRMVIGKDPACLTEEDKSIQWEQFIKGVHGCFF
jgi:hypothetical protein